MDMSLVSAAVVLIVLGSVILIGVISSKVRKEVDSGCCGCLGKADSKPSIVGFKDLKESDAAVQLRSEAGRGGVRSYTWPWKNRRPSTRHGGKGSDMDSAVIFSSNSLCLKVERDEDDYHADGPQAVLSLVASNAEEDMELFKKDQMSLHSVMIDFEEEVLKSVSELKTEEGEFFLSNMLRAKQREAEQSQSEQSEKALQDENNDTPL